MFSRYIILWDYTMTDEEIQDEKKKIDSMSHYDLGYAWRFYPTGHPWFTDEELSNHFKKRFYSLKGFTPELSKAIGWKKYS